MAAFFAQKTPIAFTKTMINKPKQENCASGQIIFRDQKYDSRQPILLFLLKIKIYNLHTRHHVVIKM